MEDQQRISIYTDFLKYCYRELGIKQAPKIDFTTDKKFATTNHSFGGYVPSQQSIIVYINNRNIADVLRTLAHELVHHSQNENGLINQESGETGSDIENEANSKAGILLRNYGKVNPIIYERVDMSILKEDLQKYELYCDMDGVLCDFDAQFDHYFGLNPKEYIQDRGEKSFENAIEEGGIEFWSTMPWFPNSEKLWSRIGKFGVNILSSPSNFSAAKEGKLLWIKKHLNPQPKKIIFKQTGDKHTILTGKSQVEIEHSVLIDDYSVNLKPWMAMGGIGIKHENESNTSHILQTLDKNDKTN